MEGKKTLMLLVIFFLIFVKAIWPKFHLRTDVLTRADTVSIRVAEVDIKSKDSLAEDLFPSCVLPIMEQNSCIPLLEKYIAEHYLFVE